MPHKPTAASRAALPTGQSTEVGRPPAKTSLLAWVRQNIGSLLAVLVTIAVLLLPFVGSTWPGWHGESNRSVKPVYPSSRPVVFVGATGLTWADIKTSSTAARWIDQGKADVLVANVGVRSKAKTSCSAEGWAQATGQTRVLARTDGACPRPSAALQSGLAATLVKAAGEGSGKNGWSLHQAVLDEGVAISGVGPGAAIALTGIAKAQVSPALPATTEELAAAVSAAGNGLQQVNPPYFPEGEDPTGPQTGALLVVDADGPPGVPVLPRIEAILRVLPADATVVLAGVADSPTGAGDPILRLGLVRTTANTLGNGQAAPGIVPELKRPGFARPADLLATAVYLSSEHSRGTFPAYVMQGTFATGNYLRPTTTAAAQGFVPELLVANQRASAVQMAAPICYVLLGLLLFKLLRDLQRKYRLVQRANCHGDFSPPLGPVEETARTAAASTIPSTGKIAADSPADDADQVRISATFAAAVPLAIIVTSAGPWTALPWAAIALPVIAVLVAATLSAIAHRLPWSGQPVGPVVTVAAWTLLLLGADIWAGSPLQVDMPLGIQLLEGARFFGSNNSSAALITVSSLLLTGVLLPPLARRLAPRGNLLLQRSFAVAGTLFFGGLVLTWATAPGLGADLGGAPMLTAGFLLLIVGLIGLRLTWPRFIGGLMVIGACVLGLAWWDWSRPAERQTHLGRFVDSLTDGSAWTTIVAKVEVNLTALGIAFAALWVVLVIAVFWVRRRLGWGVTELLTQLRQTAAASYHLLHALPPAQGITLAVLVALVVGAVVNDSGVVVFGVGLFLAIPAFVQAIDHLGRATAGQLAIAEVSQVPSTTSSGQ